MNPLKRLYTGKVLGPGDVNPYETLPCRVSSKSFDFLGVVFEFVCLKMKSLKCGVYENTGIYRVSLFKQRPLDAKNKGETK